MALTFNFFKLNLLLVLVLATFVLGNASTQFHLRPDTVASECYLTCHDQAVAVVDQPGHEGEAGYAGNSFYAIGPNCKLDAYRTFISQCLPAICRSPPDVAYAMEYGQSLCRRAGVKFVVELPEAYLNTRDGAYFSSELYLSSDAEQVMVTSTVHIGLAVGLGIGVAALQFM